MIRVRHGRVVEILEFSDAAAMHAAFRAGRKARPPHVPTVGGALRPDPQRPRPPVGAQSPFHRRPPATWRDHRATYDLARRRRHRIAIADTPAASSIYVSGSGTGVNSEIAFGAYWIVKLNVFPPNIAVSVSPEFGRPAK